MKRMIVAGLVWLMTGMSGAAAADERPVNFVVTAAYVSNKGIPVYQEMADYLGRKIGRRAQVISGLSYTEADLMLAKGIIQIGFVCGLPYTHAGGNYRLLAMPSMSMKAGVYSDAPGYEGAPHKYFSYTIVRKDAPYKSWQDLRGHSYAFNEQNSNSGYNMPRYKLVQLGAKRWDDWFSRVVASGSHEESIRMVSQGRVDASSVDSMVLDFDRSINNNDALNVKVIEVLGYPQGAGSVPVVISNRADPDLGPKLQAALLKMHEDPEGARILAKARIARFDLPDDHNYDDIRQMEAAAHRAGFHDFEQ